MRNSRVLNPLTLAIGSWPQITKIFKQHAADNPILNDKLEEFLTLAAVVRTCHKPRHSRPLPSALCVCDDCVWLVLTR